MEHPPSLEIGQNEIADRYVVLPIGRGQPAFLELMQPAIIDDARPFERAIGVEPRFLVRNFLAQAPEQAIEIGKRQVRRFLIVRRAVIRAVPAIERP